tara:strand:- start:2131 stop:3006 length:876 start_codon:yes stop_codon:yes gene_type:complete
LFNKFLYLFNEGLLSLWRTKVPSIVSSLAISVSLIIVSITYSLYLNFEYIIIDFKDSYKIEVFFNDDLSKKNCIESFNDILLINGIDKGQFIDKDMAANKFKREFKEDINDVIGRNPLPMSAIYDINEENRNYNSIKSIINEIEKNTNVESITYEKDAMIQFDNLIKNILAFIFFISLLIILVAVFFVSNTILIIIYSKKRDIEILKLLGASNQFIKFPYYLEGIFQGIIGSLISLIILALFYNILEYLSLSNYIYLDSVNSINMIVLNFSFGMLLGFLGSSKALSSYVKN